MSNERRKPDNVTRRGVLKGTAAVAGTAATAGKAGAYRDVTDFDFRHPPVQETDGEGRTIVLLGIVGGWVGVGPDELDGVSNPTLRLIEGEENRIIWINGDGSHHNFVLADEDGDAIEATEFIEETGEFTTLEVTPDEEMEQYYCQPHPVQMRGPVEFIDADDVHELRVRVRDKDGNPLEAEVFVDDRHSFSDIVGRPDPGREEEPEAEEEEPDPDPETGAEEEAEETVPEEDEIADDDEDEEQDNGDEDEQEGPRAVARFDLLEDGEYEIEVWTYGHERVTGEVTIDGDDEEVTVQLPEIETDEPAETFSLRLEEGQWVGVEPDGIADEENPTLELEAGETYAVEWQNEIGRHQPEAEGRNLEPLPGHNFAIASDGDVDEWNTYVRSNFLDEECETQTVEFVADEDMGVYLDQAQLNAVGEVDVS